MKADVKNVVAAFMTSRFGRSERGIYAKECLHDATRLSAVRLARCAYDIPPAKCGAVRLTIDGSQPVYDFWIVEDVKGRVFKKKIRTLVFIGTDQTDDMEECATVADLVAFLSANQLDFESFENAIDDVGIGVVHCSDGVASDEIYFNYNVNAVHFDREKMMLSFEAEDRFYT